ncbi:MAG: hypothetical protein H0W06_09810 [Chloroflexia bacterium]|nr:hypothetical protein [Chloroflexia bacterium]
MNRFVRLVIVSVIFSTSLLIGGPLETVAQPAQPQLVELPCAEKVSAQPLDRAEPAAADGHTLVFARLTIAPGGSLGPHTYPGTGVVTVESGIFGFTLLEEGEMTIHRAGTTGTPGAEEPVRMGKEVELTAGNWFMDTGMMHRVRGIGDEPVVSTFTGLVKAGSLLVCADDPSAG